MSLETMTKLASTTVGVGGSASVVFSNIPQNYTDLCIKISCQTNRVADEGGLSLQLNSATTGQTYRVLAGAGSNGASSVDTAYEPLWVCRIQGGTAGANVFSNTDLYIPNYAGNKPKVILADSATEKNASIAYITLSSVVQANPAPVTSLTLSGLGGTLQQHSTFTLYGIKNAAKTAGNSIKATGGNIVFDGTYVYHVFNSTGAFVPTQPILADCLVVAGGGGGGTGNTDGTGGGGGAGGYRLLTAQTIYANSCTVTVGGGGSVLTSGTNSSISGSGSINISATGGGRASGLTTPASSGGSGGGGAGNNLPTGGAGNAGSYTPVEGYAGGTTIAFSGSGGGGASGIGIADTWNGSTGTAGNGGPGIAVNSTWAAAVGIGVNGFIAGGGGGGRDGKRSMTAAIGGVGGGGNGCSAGLSGQPGIANSGGGGGGGGNLNSTEYVAAAGGSGIVVVRYKG